MRILIKARLMDGPRKRGTSHPSSETGELRSSLTLLERAREGDRGALDTLIRRYMPRLQRWATGRLPRWARDVADTQDLVQETVFRTFKRIETFEPRGEGSLQAYLRQAILNRIREELRRANRRPPRGEFDSKAEDPGRSPLDEAIGHEAVERYERRSPRCAARIAKRWWRASSWDTRTKRSLICWASPPPTPHVWLSNAPSYGWPGPWERSAPDERRGEAA
jgi:RNA polymerase sigma factor (sigma-70 family)